jgi:hypothetical protein
MANPNLPQEKFERVKSFLESKTLWGIAVVVVPIILRMFGIDTGVLISENIEDIVVTSNELWNGAIVLLGSAIAAWGRIKARTKLALGKE